ncbi:MAG: hypothetical protein WKF83_03280 [Nocardioidaceae bacterium]
MVNLTRIYTRTGDDGTTSLGDMGRVSKLDLRLESYADVDEANSLVGVAIATGGLDDDVVRVRSTSRTTLDVGADLTMPSRGGPEVSALVGRVRLRRSPRAGGVTLPGVTGEASFVHPAGGGRPRPCTSRGRWRGGPSTVSVGSARGRTAPR